MIQQIEKGQVLDNDFKNFAIYKSKFEDDTLIVYAICNDFHIPIGYIEKEELSWFSSVSKRADYLNDPSLIGSFVALTEPDPYGTCIKFSVKILSNYMDEFNSLDEKDKYFVVDRLIQETINKDDSLDDILDKD